MATLRKRGDKWHVQVRRQGHSALTSSFTRKVDAEAWARKHEARIESGDLQADLSLLRSTTLRTLLARYEAEVSPGKKGHASEVYRLRAMSYHPISRSTLDKLTTTRLAAFRDERQGEVSASSVRRELAILAHCLEIARKEWGFSFALNPMTGLSLPHASKPRERRVTPQELQSIASALRTSRNPLLVRVINLAIFTGMRRSELLSLTWRNVDLQRGLAFLPDTKNGHPRHVPLSPAARSVLTGLDRGKPEELVLPITANAVRLSWERLKRRAGIDNLRFHDLRHEAISQFFEAGLSMPEVSLISGHRDPRMLLRYTHLRPEAVSEKLAKVSLHRQAVQQSSS